MKKLAVLAVALVLVHPALAVKRVTVAQIEQTLAAANATHRADAELARQLGELQLTERLTDATLNKFAATAGRPIGFSGPSGKRAACDGASRCSDAARDAECGAELHAPDCFSSGKFLRNPNHQPF